MLRKALARHKHIAPVCLLLALACGYSAGNLLPGHIKKIYIPTFENETTKYGIEQDLTTAVTDVFTDDNRLSVVSEGEADAMLRGVIIKYEKGALTFDRAQTVDEFKIEITVSVQLEDLHEGKILWEEDNFRAWESYTEGGDEAEGGETQAIEAAIATLASDMLSRTMEGW
ncbi:MAG: LptE family protein [Candidatus Eisenbacteria bacterium]